MSNPQRQQGGDAGWQQPPQQHLSPRPQPDRVQPAYQQQPSFQQQLAYQQQPSFQQQLAYQQQAAYQQFPLVRKQGAWGLWWLCVVTFGIYYYIWYHRINMELAAVLRSPVPPNGQWWNQLIPIWNLVGLGATAKRLNAAHAVVGSPTRVGMFVTWFWAPAWFASQTRYLQRRMNILHDILAAKSAG